MTKKNKQRSSSFIEKVRRVVAAIPRGSVMTYSEVARIAGFPGAARAVGSLMAKNYDPNIPCHRVIRSDGKVGDYNRGGPARKIELLLQERQPA
jgi:methylated-DNA-[protein]-cysteine S-methyltransferase